MKKGESKTIDIGKGVTLFEMFDYFCSRINFARSPIDNDAVICMNRLFLELRKNPEKFTE